MNCIFGKTLKRGFSYFKHEKHLKLPYRLKEHKLTLDIVKPTEMKEFAACTAKIFSMDETLMKGCGASQNDLTELTFDTLKHSMEPSISVAFRTDSSDIASGYIMEHISTEDNSTDANPSIFHPKYEPVITLLNKNINYFRDYYRKNRFTGKVALVAFGSTEAPFRGKGLKMYVYNALLLPH